MKSEKKIISIVGSNGYIGMPLLYSMSNLNYLIYSISRSPVLKKNKNIKSVKFDVNKGSEWLRAVSKSDIIIYLVAQTDLNLSEREPAYDMSITVTPFLSLLASTKNKTIIYLSTVTIYDHENKNIISEDCSDFPKSQYDKHKKIAENALNESIRKGDNKGFILRLSNVYGYSIGEKENNRSILNKMIKRTFVDEDITVYGKGNYLRDYIYIDDVIDVIKTSICNIEKLNGLTLILSSGSSIKIKDVFELVSHLSSRILNSKSKLIYVPQPVDMHYINKRSVLYRNNKIKELLEWTPKYTIESGVEKTINLFNSNQNK